jgi:hypothetical protein
MRAQHLITEKKEEAENGGKLRRKVFNLQKSKLEKKTIPSSGSRNCA